MSKIVAIVALVLIISAGAYFLVLNKNTATITDTALKADGYAEYTFIVQPANVTGTYKWTVLSTNSTAAKILEQTKTTFGWQNYTSYLDLQTGDITRHRTTTNGTVAESICFMLTDVSRIDCRYYTALSITGEQPFNISNDERMAVKVKIDDPSYDNYMLFDKKTGIMLYSINDLGGPSSEYSIISTNIF